MDENTADENTADLPDRLADDLDAGFTALVRAYASRVYSLHLRLTGSPADADDLGQETFLRAYAALRGYPAARRRELAPRAWLMRIAVNVWRNHVRTATRRPAVGPRLEDLPAEPAADTTGPEDLAASADERARLAAVLRRLPEHHRLPVVLRHVVGLSYAEAAEVLGCPVGTVKARVSRGLDGLRAMLPASTKEMTA